MHQQNVNIEGGHRTLAVILARAGSKGLPHKNALPLAGRPLLDHTIDHAKAATAVDHIVLTTDGEHLAAIAQKRGVQTIMRPNELASDTATVDAAARHAVEQIESLYGQPFDSIVILYGNVPLRPVHLIDDALRLLHQTGCDSVQSVHPVGKHHPYWMKTVDDDGRLAHYQSNTVFRRQDLPPVHMLDGAIIAVTRASLFRVDADDPHAFLGNDRRAVITQPGDTVDIDEACDLELAAVRAKAQAHKRFGFPSKFDIHGQTVGEQHRPYVIAELGVNHDGRLDTALKLVSAAKNAGADAVKVQLFDANLLLSEDAVLAAYQARSCDDVFDMLNALQLSQADMQAIRDAAHQLDLGFIATCFSLELFDAMEALQPDAIKVASPDAVNLPLIEAMKMLGRPLLISTGTCALEELDAAANLLAGCPVSFLHCVSAYPVENDAANLPRIQYLRDRFGAPVGYSDHTRDLHAGMLAVAAHRACLIEKHLTHDCNAAGPDHAASFDPVQFAAYVKLILAGWQAHAERDTRRTSASIAEVAHSACACQPARISLTYAAD